MYMYPHFVVRHFAACYERRPCPEGLEIGQIIEEVLKIARAEKKSACVVFGESDVIYVEPDGSYQVSNQPPIGGIPLI
jgi:hypothetical protein